MFLTVSGRPPHLSPGRACGDPGKSSPTGWVAGAKALELQRGCEPGCAYRGAGSATLSSFVLLLFGDKTWGPGEAERPGVPQQAGERGCSPGRRAEDRVGRAVLPIAPDALD